jgi:energy-coupling factor transporter ATP-binding protein EcfA2
MIQKTDFRLIALRPHKDCDVQYAKILTLGELYYFYNNYQIDDNDHIANTGELDSDFFLQSETTWINLSAIVGKNGSGKSTIIELLFMGLNNLAAQQPLTQKLLKVKGVHVDIYYYSKRYYKIEAREEVKVYAYNKGKKQARPIKDFDLKDFFYTIIVNYSQHAYNDYGIKQEKSWLRRLFHKNDGYQTPVVLNPYRDAGNIDINRENHLVKSRLLANLLEPKDEHHNFRQLTPKLVATSLKLTLQTDFLQKKIYGEDSKILTTFGDIQHDLHKTMSELNKPFKFGYTKSKGLEYQPVADYVMYKLTSIALKYDDYEEYFNHDRKELFPDKLVDLAKDLFADTSHVTFKLRQALNLLKYHHLKPTKQEIDLEMLSTRIAELQPKRGWVNTILFVPPPIFNIEIVLKENLESKKEILFKTLSSGEKQAFYSTSSLLYHLRNLDSIRNWKSRKAYKYVNVVMEEIELYFHPELQRNYIKDVLDSLARTRFERITGINICFVTHSPFILSDIPANNVMFLDQYGKSDRISIPTQTFGGNIHQLLGCGFFLSNGLTGAFAQKKLQRILEQLDGKNPETRQVNPITYSKEDIYQTLQIVGEPFLKKVLMEKYYRSFEKEERIKILQDEIDTLRQSP